MITYSEELRQQEATDYAGEPSLALSSDYRERIARMASYKVHAITNEGELLTADDEELENLLMADCDILGTYIKGYVYSIPMYSNGLAYTSQNRPPYPTRRLAWTGAYIHFSREGRN